MLRFTGRAYCAATLALCLVALPRVSRGQEINTDSQGRSVTTTPAPSVSSPSVSQQVKPSIAIPEGTTTIYSNFGSGYSYQPDIGWTEGGPTSTVGPYLQAMSFTPKNGFYIVTQIDLAIGYLSGTGGYKLELHADNHGKPGRRIAHWNVTGLPTFGTCCSVNTIKVPLLPPVILLQGQQYWLVPIVNSDEWAAWNWNNVSVNGNGALSTDGGSTWTPESYSPNGAFDVLGLP